MGLFVRFWGVFEVFQNFISKYLLHCKGYFRISKYPLHCKGYFRISKFLISHLFGLKCVLGYLGGVFGVLRDVLGLFGRFWEDI